MTREEAINILRETHDNALFSVRTALETLAPELAESEDERIRKMLIEKIEKWHEQALENNVVQDIKDSADIITYLEKQKDASKAIEAVDRIDKYIDEHLANAQEMRDSNPDKKYYRGWDDALDAMAGILIDVYSEEKQKETLRDFIDNFPYSDKQKEQKSNLVPKIIRPKFAVGDTVCRNMWSDHTIREIYIDCDDPVYICINEEGIESHISFSEQDEWERKEQKPAGKPSMLKTLKEHLANTPREQLDAEFEALKDLTIDKPTEWSEKDSDVLLQTAAILKANFDSDEKFEDCDYDCETLAGKLLEMRYRISPSWKPSEEQMEALNTLNLHGDLSYVGQQNQLISLYQDLKKLM